MKKYLLYLLVTLYTFSLASCGGYESGIGIIKSDWESKNEVIINNELKSFLDTNKIPKVVLRVPQPPQNVTESEENKYLHKNIIYNEIEKIFMIAGFTVRDRALLSNLLKSENLNYEEIGKKIDTDIIIEITDFEYAVPNKKTKFTDKITNETIHLGHKIEFVNPTAAKIEGKIIIVEKGQLGGLFTFYLSACGTECTFKYYYYGERNMVYGLNYINSGSKFLTSLTWTSDYNDETRKNAAKYFAEKIKKIFTGY